MILHELPPVFPVRSLPSQNHEVMKAPYGLEGQDRGRLAQDEYARFRVQLGDGPELQQQWDRVLEFFAAATTLHARLYRPFNRNKDLDMSVDTPEVIRQLAGHTWWD